MQINQRKRNIYWVNTLKLHIGCEACGKMVESQDDLQNFHFDHIDPASKLANVSRLASAGVSTKRLVEEIEKCQILCLDCHIQKHGVQNAEQLYIH